MVARYSVIRRARWTGGAPLLMMVACGGGSGSTASSMMPPAAGQSPPLMATFDSIQSNIFTPLCATCHSGANPPVNLNLDATHSYNDLINVPSTEQPTIVRVKPGDPMNSFLVQHIQSEGDGASPTDLTFIEQWITDGAPPSASAMSMAEKFQVASVQPDTGDQLSAAPARVIVGFTQELDASRIDGTSAVLERMASDGGANTKVPALVALPAGNPRALIVTPRSALLPGSYRLVIDPPDGTAIGSIGSAALSAPMRGESGRVVTQFDVL
jgi:hypothetical protein